MSSRCCTRTSVLRCVPAIQFLVTLPAGYDHKFELGTGGHSGKQGGAMLPDVLRWLWRDAVK